MAFYIQNGNGHGSRGDNDDVVSNLRAKHGLAFCSSKAKQSRRSWPRNYSNACTPRCVYTGFMINQGRSRRLFLATYLHSYGLFFFSHQNHVVFPCTILRTREWCMFSSSYRYSFPVVHVEVPSVVEGTLRRCNTLHPRPIERVWMWMHQRWASYRCDSRSHESISTCVYKQQQHHLVIAWSRIFDLIKHTKTTLK